MNQGQGMNGGRPLSGIRVIDFGHYIAGPAAAMMMSSATSVPR